MLVVSMGAFSCEAGHVASGDAASASDAASSSDAGPGPDARPGPDAGPRVDGSGPTPLWFDDFESADFSGFTWTDKTRTSIVRDDGCVVNNGQPIQTCGLEARQWESRPGSGGRHALRFYYPAGVAMSEQRFDLPQPLSDLWICYWIRVPLNFSHPGGNDNQKFFALWQDIYEYDGSGATTTFQFRGLSGGGSHVSNYQVVPVESGLPQRHTGESGTATLWTEADRLRWAEICLHMRNGANGVVEQWRRWADEGSFSPLYTKDIDLGTRDWTQGYVMGWANAAYPENTEFLVDDFAIYAERPF